MVNILTRLNGWQRLWFVFAVICFVVTTIFAVIVQKKPNAVEDEALLAKLNADDVITIDILIPSREIATPTEPWKADPIVQKVAFPKDIHNINARAILAYLRQKDLQLKSVGDSILTEYASDRYPEIVKDIENNRYINPDTVRSIAVELMTERNKYQAIRAKTENNEVRKSNMLMTLYSYIVWLTLITSVYIAGLAIGWIRKGFKKS